MEADGRDGPGHREPRTLAVHRRPWSSRDSKQARPLGLGLEAAVVMKIARPRRAARDAAAVLRTPVEEALLANFHRRQPSRLRADSGQPPKCQAPHRTGRLRRGPLIHQWPCCQPALLTHSGAVFFVLAASKPEDSTWARPPSPRATAAARASDVPLQDARRPEPVPLSGLQTSIGSRRVSWSRAVLWTTGCEADDDGCKGSVSWARLQPLGGCAAWRATSHHPLQDKGSHCFRRPACATDRRANGNAVRFSALVAT